MDAEATLASPAASGVDAVNRPVGAPVPLLQVRDLNQYYGGSHILRGVDLAARQGGVTTLLGRNGVGKTTLLKCLMGLVPARSGSILFDGQDITRLSPTQRARLGLA